MDERTEHEALLEELAVLINKFQDVVDRDKNPLYAEAASDLRKVFSYLYVFGGQKSDDSSSAETSN